MSSIVSNLNNGEGSSTNLPTSTMAGSSTGNGKAVKIKIRVKKPAATTTRRKKRSNDEDNTANKDVVKRQKPEKPLPFGQPLVWATVSILIYFRFFLMGCRIVKACVTHSPTTGHISLPCIAITSPYTVL
jgi:hypothetical protein